MDRDGSGWIGMDGLIDCLFDGWMVGWVDGWGWIGMDRDGWIN